MSCKFIRISGSRKGDICSNSICEKSELYCARHYKLTEKRSKMIISNILIINNFSFPFTRYNFMIPCISEFLDFGDLFSFYQCSSNIKEQTSTLWNWLAVKNGLLHNDSKIYGLKECFWLYQLQLDDKKKSYKTYILNRYDLNIEEIKHLLEEVQHRQYGTCHLVNIIEAFKIACLSHDGLDNITLSKKLKNEKIKQDFEELKSQQKICGDELNLWTSQLNTLQSAFLSNDILSLQACIDSKWNKTTYKKFNDEFKRTENRRCFINKNSTILEPVLKCELYESPNIFIYDEMTNEELQNKIQEQAKRIEIIKRSPAWSIFNKLSLSIQYKCREFVANNKPHRIEHAEKLLERLDEEYWLRKNTRFPKITKKELNKDHEYINAMGGYASGGWEDEDEDSNEAEIDETEYEYKRKIAISSYACNLETFNENDAPKSLQKLIAKEFSNNKDMRNLWKKYKTIQSSSISPKILNEYDSWIENADKNGWTITNSINQPWLRKVVHEMAEEVKLKTKTIHKKGKHQILIYKNKDIIDPEFRKFV